MKTPSRLRTHHCLGRSKQLNQLVKQQQEMITSRDNIIETQKLHISHLEKQITKNVPTGDLLQID